MSHSTKLFALLLGVGLVSFNALGQLRTGWTLVWSDEFSQPDGSSPDPSKWTYDTGGGGWGNSELEYYTSRTNNARIEGGNLVIEARQESFGGSSYTSARMKTQGLISWDYGRIEARIKIPRGQGIWPAFWVMGTNITSVGWPTCGEVDIMENIGKEPTLVHGTAHGPGYSGGNGISGPCGLFGGGAYADNFHIYALEWTTNKLAWFVDGQQYWSVTPASLPTGSTWVFTKPQFILLNVAVGGQWPGNPDGTTVFPQQMLVDYVRVYAPANLTSCTSNLLNDPGFEAGGLTGWTTYGAGGNTLLQGIKSQNVHDGSNVFKVFGQFNGVQNYSGAFQDLPASPGQTLIARGWALTPLTNAIASPNVAWIEATFRDSQTNIIGLYRSNTIDSNTPPGLWFNLPVTNQFDPTTFGLTGTVSNLVAPANTAFARLQLLFRQQSNASGSVLFDDLTMAPQPQSGTPVLHAIARVGPAITISFPTFLGQTYQVIWSDNLTDPNWQTMTNLVGNGTIQTVADGFTTARRFFQTMLLCN